MGPANMVPAKHGTGKHNANTMAGGPRTVFKIQKSGRPDSWFPTGNRFLCSSGNILAERRDRLWPCYVSSSAGMFPRERETRRHGLLLSRFPFAREGDARFSPAGEEVSWFIRLKCFLWRMPSFFAEAKSIGEPVEG
jgi:hypothetical protein